MDVELQMTTGIGRPGEEPWEWEAMYWAEFELHGQPLLPLVLLWKQERPQYIPVPGFFQGNETGSLLQGDRPISLGGHSHNLEAPSVSRRGPSSH